LFASDAAQKRVRTGRGVKLAGGVGIEPENVVLKLDIVGAYSNHWPLAVPVVGIERLRTVGRLKLPSVLLKSANIPLAVFSLPVVLLTSA
jgi:hypothetical protein